MAKQGGYEVVLGCRRIVLRVLIWRHSARQHHLVLRGFSSPLVSSRPRQSPGFNIKPSLIWSSRSPPLFSVPPPVSVSAMADSRWIFCHCTDVPSPKPDMHNRTRKGDVTFMKTQWFPRGGIKWSCVQQCAFFV